MAAKAFAASLGHPSELYALVKFKLSLKDPDTLYNDPSEIPHERNSPEYARAMCYYYLNRTSRSFARVIQELDEELRHPICLFYLVLRGLDTVEDDMTIPVEKKLKMLREFDTYLYKKGWNFDGNGPQEKDRDLLVDFQYVIDEFLRLKKEYQVIIAEITKRMGDGFADFSTPGRYVVTMKDYNLYTHYAAGLVGLGLVRLFVASKLETDLRLVKREDLANNMGLFLQKVNIIKDYMQDLEEGRRFWPEEVVKDYAPPKEGGVDMKAFAEPQNLERGLACLNHLCADALGLVPDCLEFMSMLKNKSVFQFCAIPQMMAIATIALFFNNPAIFAAKKGVKIRRGLTVKLILQSTSIASVKAAYQKYLLELHAKNHAAVGKNEYDQSFFKVSLALGKIQKWLNVHNTAHPETHIKPANTTFDVALAVLVVMFAIAMAYYGYLPLTNDTS
ncbi:Farnesyl-diphosphate farnesyltransferase [Quaeritorhiza haematococci]|nr:Farnesyl-diphosphate farnesyltransferase [Quaeritorhiza haematococci]